MSSITVFDDDSRRLRALAEYQIVSTPPEPGYDAIARVAATVCHTPIAVVSFIDADRQIFKAGVGTALTSVSRGRSFCELVLTSKQPVTIPDLRVDPRFATHPLVTDPAGVRSYAGVPIRSHSGEVIGTVSVFDHRPRQLSTPQLEGLNDLALGVTALLEVRRAQLTGPAVLAPLDARQTRDLRLARDEAREILDKAADAFVSIDSSGLVESWNGAAEKLFGYRHDQAVGVDVADLILRPASLQLYRATLRALALEPSRHLSGVREIVVLHRDRTELPVELRAWAVQTRAGWRYHAFLKDLRSELAARAQVQRALDERAAAVAELAERRDYTDAVLDSLPIGILACDTDGDVILTNRTYLRFGAAPDRVLEPSDRPGLLDFAAVEDEAGPSLPPERLPLMRALHGESVSGEEMFVRGPDATRRVVARARPVRAGGAADSPILGAVTVCRDVTEERARDTALSASGQRFRAGFENSPLGMAMMNEQGELCDVNASLCRILGRTADQLTGSRLEDFLLPGDATDLRHQIHQAAHASTATGRKSERRYRAADGSVVYGQVTVVRVSGDDGKPLLLVQFEDITEQRRAQDELARSALRDSLTGLGNRLLVTDRMHHALQRAHRTGVPVAVMFIDLDGFKVINDGLGHAAGDDALRGAAERIRAAVRPEDTVARLGGDEFVVLCEDVDADEAATLAAGIEADMQLPLKMGSEHAVVTASIGVTVYDPDHDAGDGAGAVSVESMMQDADAAMYRAKQDGKNRHSLFHAGLRREVEQRSHVLSVLRRALQGDGTTTPCIEVHYQPVLDLQSGRPFGVEALCRLRDTDGSLIPPGAFIGVAEDTGLIVELGQRVLEQATEQTARWHRAGQVLHVAVNVAAGQAALTGFADSVLATCERIGFPAWALVVELTESALIEADPGTIRGLRTLREAGVGVAIDDFGTRYASLRYLQKFPVSELKIDQSFVAGLPNGREEKAIVAAIVALARDLELSCVAEGIETEEQRAALAAHGVFGQGYLLSRPGDAETITRWLEGR